MRIVIVEDEPNIREGIVRILEEHTAHRVVAALPSGELGYQAILEENPDLILTDIRMGDMSGLDMLEQLRLAGNESMAVVLTGFSSFEYARQAIHLSVVDYLLKPITVKGLLECLEKVEARSSLSISPTLEQMLITRLNGGEVEEKALRQGVYKQHEVDADAEHLLVLLRLKSMDNESFQMTVNQINQKITMLCLEQVVLLELVSRQEILLLVLQSERNPHLEATFEEYLLPAVLEEVRCVSVAVRMKALDKFKEVVEDCRTAQKYSLLIPETQFITNARVENLPLKNLSYPDELERQMKQAVRLQDAVRMNKLADEFSALVFVDCYTPESIREGMVRFLCTLCVTAEEKNPRMKGTVSYNDLLIETNGITSMKDLCAYFKQVPELLAKNCTESVGQVNSTVVSRVITYIQRHYMEDLPLTELAAHMNLTPEYVSNLFSKEMGISFSAFLKNFRISHARRLLDEHRDKIQDVAMQVGFRDPKYFNRVFKEVCGISPSEYRTSLH